MTSCDPSHIPKPDGRCDKSKELSLRKSELLIYSQIVGIWSRWMREGVTNGFETVEIGRDTSREKRLQSR